MEELIVSREKLEQNRKNELMKDEIKKDKAKQIKLRNVCTEIIFIGLLTLIIMWAAYLNSKIQNEAIEGCLENGYSYTYCVEHS